MKNIRTFLLFVFILPTFMASASNAEVMQPGNGKIFVVLAVVLVTFVGVLFLLIRLDRKLSQIENQISAKDES